MTPKLFIPISCNGSGDGKTGWAVAMMTAFNGRHVRIENMGGSHADRACNNMANRFLETDCDIMLVIDIDTSDFTERTIERLLGHFGRGHKAIWGIYPKKQDEAIPCVNTWPEVPPPDEHGLVDVRRSGRGFMAVHRSVFEALKEENGGPAKRYHNHGKTEWAFFHSGVVDGDWSAVIPGYDDDGVMLREWISEDWMFCEDIRIFLGIPTLVDTGIVLSHIGAKTYRFPQDQVICTDAPKSWRDIHGWFDYEDLYRMIVGEIPNYGRFVEVGSWMGKSIAAFESFASEASKQLETYAVDTFQGKPANPTHAAILEAHGGSVRKAFDANIAALGVDALPIQEPSDKAAIQFADGTCYAVFIDADHSYESVLADIRAWLPKVKPGGILAGHDFDEEGVWRAVQESGLKVETMGRCWVHRKP